MDLWAEIVSNYSNFNTLPWFLFNLINDDAFVLAAMTDACSMVHLVCLFIKTHVLVLLQDNCLDLVHCAFLHKLSVCVRNMTAFCQHLLRLRKSSVLPDTWYIGKTQILADISTRLIYWSISTLENFFIKGCVIWRGIGLHNKTTKYQCNMKSWWLHKRSCDLISVCG